MKCIMHNHIPYFAIREMMLNRYLVLFLTATTNMRPLVVSTITSTIAARCLAVRSGWHQSLVPVVWLSARPVPSAVACHNHSFGNMDDPSSYVASIMQRPPPVRY